MEYVRLGRSSLRVSRIACGAMGFGSPSWRPWVLDEDQARPVIARALELGINLFDTCDFYSQGESERVLGRALKDMASREEVVIATKVGLTMGKGANAQGYSRKHIIEAVDASLKRLGTDYIDIYQTHIWDPAADIEELVEAFDSLVRSGKVLYVGAADMPAWQLAKAVYTARLTGRHSFASFQHHYNLLWREDETEAMPFCTAEGVGLLPYSPMARGYLPAGRDGLERDSVRAGSDEYARIWYGRDEDRDVAAAVTEVAAARGLSPAVIALAWVLNRWPNAAPIVGACSVEHLDEAVGALGVELSDAEIEQLQAAYRPRLSHEHR